MVKRVIEKGLKNPAKHGYSRLNMVITRLFGFAAFLTAITLGLSAPELQAQTSDGPHWRTLRFDEVNMRVGPSREYKIDWVYRRKGLPVKVLRKREGWLLIQDHEGTQGWVASSQTTTRTGAMIVGDGLADMRAEPNATSELQWRAEVGVVGDLLRCRDTFCEIDVAGRSGWVAQDRLWGVGDVEVEAVGPSIETVPLPSEG